MALNVSAPWVCGLNTNANCYIMNERFTRGIKISSWPLLHHHLISGTRTSWAWQFSPQYFSFSLHFENTQDNTKGKKSIFIFFIFFFYSCVCVCFFFFSSLLHSSSNEINGADDDDRIIMRCLVCNASALTHTHTHITHSEEMMGWSEEN